MPFQCSDFTEPSPVEPLHPPMTLAHNTEEVLWWYLSHDWGRLSVPLHQPGLESPGYARVTVCWVKECKIRITLSLSSLRFSIRLERDRVIVQQLA